MNLDELESLAITSVSRGYTPDFIKASGKYHGEGRGYTAWRNPYDCPPLDASDHSLWPGKPTFWWRVIMWAKWAWFYATFRPEIALGYKETILLWKTKPFMRIGEIWWRPWFKGGAKGRFEFIDPSNGLHRYDIQRDDDEDWPFNEADWHELVARLK